MRNTGNVGIAALLGFTALFTLGAGCTVPNTGEPEMATLDQPALVTTSGARPESQLGVHREGPLDPIGHDLTVDVRDAKITLRTDDAVKTALVTDLSLALDDMDLPASPEMPDGLKMREQRLSTPDPRRATVVSKSADQLVLHIVGRLKYDAKMVLADGTLYPLGSSYTEISDLDLRITRAKDGRVTVTLDASPDKACASIGDLITLSRCALYVEADGHVTGMLNQ